MKILFLTAEGFDTPNANNQMAETLINAFLDHGIEVHLVQSIRKEINPPIPSSLIGRTGFSYDNVKRKVVDKTNFVRRYFNDVHYAFLSMRRWKKSKDADIVYLQSNPTIVFPMALLKLFYRKPIVYSIYDVFPGHAYSIGVVKSKLLYNIMRFVQKPCYRWADVITVLGEDMRAKVIREGAAASKVFVIPAWFDDSNTHEIIDNNNAFIKKYNLDMSKFYIQFAGTVGYVFNYHTVIELAKKIRNEKNILIQIVGDGNVKQQFEDEAKTLGLDNILFYPLQPVSIVPDVYSACDLCLIPLQHGVIGNGIPSKAPILMACRRVIVNSVEKDSYYARSFSENDMGIAVEIDDVDGLADEILRLYRSPNDIERMANNAYAYGKERYSSTRSIGLLLDVFHSVQERHLG